MDERNAEAQDKAIRHYTSEAGKIVGKAKVWALIIGIGCAYLGARSLGWCYNLIGIESSFFAFASGIVAYGAIGVFFVVAKNFTYRTAIKTGKGELAERRALGSATGHNLDWESFKDCLEVFVSEEEKIIKPEEGRFCRWEYLEWLVGVIVLIGLLETLGFKNGRIESGKVDDQEAMYDDIRWDRNENR